MALRKVVCAPWSKSGRPLSCLDPSAISKVLFYAGSFAAEQTEGEGPEVQFDFERIVMTLGLSTRWRSGFLKSGHELMEAIAATGAKGVELGYPLTIDTLDEAITASHKRELELLSIHAMLPVAPGEADENRGVKLSAIDDDSRRAAVAKVNATIRLAGEQNIKAVILNAGHVPMGSATDRLRNAFDKGETGTPKGMKLVNSLKITRLENRESSFERLLLSLSEIHDAADKAGVYVGLKNRYHLSGFPCFEELAIVFLRMAGSRIRYWHDPGHAQVQENLGLGPAKVYLEEFGAITLGVHLHDAKGYEDRLPPPYNSTDGVDFTKLISQLAPEVIKVVQLRPSVTPEKARYSLEWLASIGY